MKITVGTWITLGIVFGKFCKLNPRQIDLSPLKTSAYFIS